MDIFGFKFRMVNPVIILIGILKMRVALVLQTRKNIEYINISIDTDHTGTLNEYPCSKPQAGIINMLSAA